MENMLWRFDLESCWFSYLELVSKPDHFNNELFPVNYLSDASFFVTFFNTTLFLKKKKTIEEVAVQYDGLSSFYSSPCSSQKELYSIGFPSSLLYCKHLIQTPLKTTKTIYKLYPYHNILKIL